MGEQEDNRISWLPRRQSGWTEYMVNMGAGSSHGSR